MVIITKPYLRSWSWFSDFILFLSLFIMNKVIKYTGGVFVAMNYF